MASQGSCFEDSEALASISQGLESAQIDAPYEYSPIKENHIRIITIQAGTGDEPLQLRLDEVALSNPHDYTALSYAWEGQATDVGLRIDGRLFTVSHNVHEALRTLRKEASDTRVWVDAICINQADLMERNSQVQIMGAIYKGCDFVTVWLGDADDYTASTVKSIEQLAELRDCFKKEPIPVAFNFKAVLNDDQVFDLQEFFCRPWFSRLWTFQEYVLGKVVMFRIGLFTISPRRLYGASKWAEDHHRSWGLGHGHRNFLRADKICDVYQHPKRYCPHNRFDLINLLSQTRQRHATDTRDKIFGLLALATETYGIVVDYSKTKVEIFTGLARYLLQESESLRTLGLAHGSSDCSSWVPDWTYDPNYPVSLHADFVEQQQPFKASHNTKCKLRVSDEVPNEIELGGKILDEISQTFSYNELIPVELGAHNRCQFEKLFSSISEVFPSEEMYAFTGEPHEDVYLRTIMIDLALESERTTDRFRRIYYSAAIRKQELDTVCPEELEIRVQEEILELIYIYARGRAMFRTSKGYIGIMPQAARAGDLLCLFLGGEVLYILRPEEQAGKYKFIGECYAHGLMDGEALQGVDIETEVFDTFTLV